MDGMEPIDTSLTSNDDDSSSLSSSSPNFRLQSQSLLCCDPVISIDISKSVFDKAIPKDLSNFEPKCRLEYEVDSMVPITMKPIVDKLRDIFKILNDIEGIIIFMDQLFISLRLLFAPLVCKFLYRAGDSLGQFSPIFQKICCPTISYGRIMVER